MKKCIAGCKHYTGGEIYHHKDCPFYPESLSKLYDDLKDATNNRTADLIEALTFYADSRKYGRSLVGHIGGKPQYEDERILLDKGEIARKALKRQ